MQLKIDVLGGSRFFLKARLVGGSDLIIVHAIAQFANACPLCLYLNKFKRLILSYLRKMFQNFYFVIIMLLKIYDS